MFACRCFLWWRIGEHARPGFVCVSHENPMIEVLQNMISGIHCQNGAIRGYAPSNHSTRSCQAARCRVDTSYLQHALPYHTTCI
jgi:hypothetical protein